MRSGLLKLSYWFVAATAVVLVAGVWWRLAHLRSPAATHGADQVALGEQAQPADHARTPDSPALVQLRQMLPALAKQADADDRAAIAAFYEARSGPLLWVTETGVSEKGAAVITELGNADDWGLRSSDFPVPQLSLGHLSPRLRPRPRSS